MKRTAATPLTAIVALLLAATACTGAGSNPVPWEGSLPAPGSAAGPVWLVGVDGASWDLLGPLLLSGKLPHVAALLERGAHGTLLSEDPTISPALWATIATGVSREHHGVENFVTRLPGSYDEVEVGPLDRRWPAVWDLVGAAGGTSLVVSWFGSYPAEAIRGAYVAKGLDPANPQAGQVHPPELAELIAEQARVRLPRAALEQIGRTEFLRQRLLEDARSLAVFETLVERVKPDFAAVYFSGVDVAQHVTWMHMDPGYQSLPGDPPPRRELAGVIEAYYRFVDWAVGRIVEAAPHDATIVLVSDHGAGPMDPEDAFHFQLEVLLEELGYTARLAGKRTDWSATTAFTISELYRDEKHIWLNLAGVEPQGTVELDEAESTARMIAARLRALETDREDPLFDRVEVDCESPGWPPGEPALTVRFADEALWSAIARDGERELDMNPVRLRHADVSGGHRPEGVWIAAGPAVRAGELDRPASLYDVAPTLLYLLGLPQNGRAVEVAPRNAGVLTGAIRPDFLELHPVRVIPDYPDTDRSAVRRPGAGVPLAPDPAAEESLEKLRSLGYIN